MEELKSVGDVLAFYIGKIIHDTKKNLEDKGKNAKHTLAASIRPGFADSIEITKNAFGNTYKATVIMEDYYQWVDEGRKPGKQPPIDSIIEWINYKEGFKLRGADKIGDLRERGKNKLKPYTLQDIVRGNAFGIARKMGSKGTKGSRFYSDVVNEKLIKDLNKDLSKALKKDVQVDFKNFTDNKEFLQSGKQRYGNNN